MPSGSHARSEASRRDHQRTSAAAEAGAEPPRTEDRQQRANGAEYAVEEGGGMGRARTAAVRNQVVAQSEEDDEVPRLRSVRAVVNRCSQARNGCVPDGVSGR